MDDYLLWDELSEVEKRKLREGLTADPEPLSREERDAWVDRFDGICLSSRRLLPVPRQPRSPAEPHHVQYVAQPGGSARDDVVTAAADQYGMAMVHTGLRLFLH